MSLEETSSCRGRLLAELDEAARVIAPLWPISTFIAVNPLWDLRQLGFGPAIVAARKWLGVDGYPAAELLADAYRSGRITDADLSAALVTYSNGHSGEVATHERPTASPLGTQEGRQRPTAVNREVAKWCAAHLATRYPDGGPVAFYDAWRAGVALDPGASRLVGRAGRARLAQMPRAPEDAILECLRRLGLAPRQWRDELANQLSALPGWAGLAKWRSQWAPRDHGGPVVELLDLVAVRLAYDAEVRSEPPSGRRARKVATRRRSGESTHAGDEAPRGGSRARLADSLPSELRDPLHRLGEDDAAWVWLSAYEGHFRDWLLGELDRGSTRPAVGPPAVQFICCIDTRSEGLRRHLESIGHYETLGFAGFFALPMRYRPLGAEAVDLCPVLTTASVDVAEVPAPGSEAAARRKLAGQRARARSAHAFESAREGSLSAYVTAEATGLFAVPLLAAKTLGPARYRRLRDRAARFLSPSASTVVRAEVGQATMADEQARFAETALVTMGLTRGFAPLVVLCGHGSTTENNPHASALDCGACGGNRGADSARAVAAILNRPEIRSRLAQREIAIPESTWFLAAEHDTATDRVRLLDTQLVPPGHAEALAHLARDLDVAGSALAEERVVSLAPSPRRSAVREVGTRSADWAEVQPEWGLARNAAFIVGPRSMTAGVDLQRRTFLHSYDASTDPDGSALESILTAPLVVAHWINAQYYFSTVDPDVYGAGDKTVHNIVAGIGVTEGADVDLRIGLPIQSVFDGERPYHEPVRLLAVIQAPLTLIDAVIDRTSVLRDLFDGEWIHLAARPDASGRWHLRRPGGAWIPWASAGNVTYHPMEPAVPGGRPLGRSDSRRTGRRSMDESDLSRR